MRTLKEFAGGDSLRFLLCDIVSIVANASVRQLTGEFMASFHAAATLGAACEKLFPITPAEVTVVQQVEWNQHEVWIWRKLSEVLLLINCNFSNNERVEAVRDQMGRRPACLHACVAVNVRGAPTHGQHMSAENTGASSTQSPVFADSSACSACSTCPVCSSLTTALDPFVKTSVSAAFIHKSRRVALCEVT